MQALAGQAGQNSSPLPLPAGLAGPEPEAGPDPLETLQECINALPGVLNSLHDPQDVQDATQALLILTKVQTRMMRQGQAQSGPPQG